MSFCLHFAANESSAPFTRKWMMSAKGLTPWGTVVRRTQSCLVLLVLMSAFPGGANALDHEHRKKCQDSFDEIQKELQTEALSAFSNSKSPRQMMSLQYQI